MASQPTDVVGDTDIDESQLASSDAEDERATGITCLVEEVGAFCELVRAFTSVQASSGAHACVTASLFACPSLHCCRTACYAHHGAVGQLREGISNLPACAASAALDASAVAEPLTRVFEQVDDIREHLVAMVRECAPAHEGTLLAAIRIDPVEHASMIIDALGKIFDRPDLVRGCHATSDFLRPSTHNAIRFFLYRHAAARLHYKEVRVPLPFELEAMIKALYPGGGPQSWTTFVPSRLRAARDSLSQLLEQ